VSPPTLRHSSTPSPCSKPPKTNRNWLESSRMKWQMCRAPW